MQRASVQQIASSQLCMNSLAKYGGYGLRLCFGRQMAIAPSDFLRRMADNVIDDALVYTGRCQTADEAMTEYVKSAHD